MMLAGFGVTLKDLPPYLYWGSYVSYLRYGLEGYVGALFYKREQLKCDAMYCHYKYVMRVLMSINLCLFIMCLYFSQISREIFEGHINGSRSISERYLCSTFRNRPSSSDLLLFAEMAYCVESIRRFSCISLLHVINLLQIYNFCSGIQPYKVQRIHVTSIFKQLIKVIVEFF